MSILAASGLDVDVAGGSLWRGVSFRVEAGEKVGLVGPNGAGKTTLLKVLLGEIRPERGEVFLAEKPGYLPQTAEAAAGLSTVWEDLLAERRDVIDLRTALRAAEEKMAAAGEDVSLLARYAALTQQYEALGGYALEADARRILAGLGLAAAQAEKSASLSGGQKTRLALARLLLAAPELLLLDEPTNHLDVEALEWLENFLTSYRGAVLVVSHDRYFLDRVARRILWLDRGALRVYGGNYSAAELQRSLELKTQAKNAEQTARKIAALEEYIRRYGAGIKARQARGREKQLARLTPVAAPEKEKALRLDLASGGRTGLAVLTVSDLTVAYGARVILRDISFTLRRGEKTALLGANGVGKTTLLRAVLGKIPSGGRVALGAGVRAAYYAQEYEDLGADGAVLDALRAVSRAEDGELRSRLARFGFRGPDVLKPVRGLSGGEKSRLALCRLFLAAGNLLLLDEPTNHIDAPTREALEEALIAYEGTALLVSHDRYFLDRVANRVALLTPESFRLWEGDYSAYRRLRQEETAAAAETPPPTAGREEWERQRLRRRRSVRDENRRAGLEREVAEREAALAAAEQAAADAGGDYEQAAAWHEKAEALRAEIDGLLTRWVEA
ncbi:MAG: ATP-binding cassette domain-containing protein [Gracilibacteraceae bacterium]|jgi:ATP-binding cassette subfamily F protein 3|nr:ATP-binding cassette domain-containing protein [Gracilibacteraceae bacterium]